MNMHHHHRRRRRCGKSPLPRSDHRPFLVARSEPEPEGGIVTRNATSEDIFECIGSRVCAGSMYSNCSVVDGASTAAWRRRKEMEDLNLHANVMTVPRATPRRAVRAAMRGPIPMPPRYRHEAEAVLCVCRVLYLIEHGGWNNTSGCL